MILRIPELYKASELLSYDACNNCLFALPLPTPQPSSPPFSAHRRLVIDFKDNTTIESWIATIQWGSIFITLLRHVSLAHFKINTFLVLTTEDLKGDRIVIFYTNLNKVFRQLVFPPLCITNGVPKGLMEYIDIAGNDVVRKRIVGVPTTDIFP
ncbi:hypothetical protein J6590_015555 [Homalodisca vitripennis]|nr:hypothetical protein J6590_015555 [Homalodisca vitripennis]